MSQATHQPCSTGGCLCGQVQYRIEATLADIAHCHCGMCRKSSGGIVTTWATVPLAAFAWTLSQPSRFASSTHAGRFFCGNCGALLALHTQRAPDTIDVTVATLDQPQQHPANRHIWFTEHLPWLHLDEDLPYEDQEIL